MVLVAPFLGRAEVESYGQVPLDAVDPAQVDVIQSPSIVPELRKMDFVSEDLSEASPAEIPSYESPSPRFVVDYDKGFVIRPFEPDKIPFDLRCNSWIQLRYHGFARKVDSWTNNAGVTRPVRNRSAFDIERGRLVFSGHAIDERFSYFLQLDGDTDGRHGVDFFDYWWAWTFIGDSGDKGGDRLRFAIWQA